MQKRIYLCLAHMSGQEQKFIQEAFDTNWVVPLGPNVNGFEDDLKQFVNGIFANMQSRSRLNGSINLRRTGQKSSCRKQ